MKRFSQAQFLRDLSTVPNSNNPFVFNTLANRRYMAREVKVFRRTHALMPQGLYNLYAQQGLFDKNHIIGLGFCYCTLEGKDPDELCDLIGEPYPPEKVVPMEEKFKKVSVTQVSSCKGYTVIKAQIPKTYPPEAKLRVSFNYHFISDSGYQYHVHT